MSGLPVHGTYAAYELGCRCDECRACQNDRVRANRADRLSRLKVHGIRSSYDAGCRCDACRKVASERNKRYYQRVALSGRCPSCGYFRTAPGHLAACGGPQ